MHASRRTAQLQAVQNRTGRLTDEIYRQMFRVEESRPGAEIALTLALLRAWLEISSRLSTEEERDWLKKVSTLSLEMIEPATDKDSSINRAH